MVIVTDTLEGGAAAAANRLVDALAARPGPPLERWHFTAPVRTTPAAERSLDPRRKRPPLERLLKHFSRRLADERRRGRHTAAFHQAIRQRQPRLVNLHCIHTCGLRHDGLLELPAALPLVWTLHDCWPFRPAAFAWAGPAGQLETACLDQPPASAAARRAEFFRQRPQTVLVAPSLWMMSEARRDVPPGTRIAHIPYGLDLNAFRPLAAVEVRAALGLNVAKLWLGYGATWVSSRKGTDLLPAALAQLDCRNLGLLVWGEEPRLEWPVGLTVKYVGRVAGTAQMCQLLAACDLFLCPSRADNLPNAVLESLACGTPVIGSETGGIPDMVRPGLTGWRFASGSAESFAAALQTAVNERAQWADYRRHSRRIAEAEYGEALQAERYRRLFEELWLEGE